MRSLGANVAPLLPFLSTGRSNIIPTRTSEVHARKLRYPGREWAALGNGGRGQPAVRAHGQELTLVHYSAQPEPFWSLQLNKYTPEKGLR